MLPQHLLPQSTVILRSCSFSGAVFGAFAGLPSGIKWFIPGMIGGNHRRLSHIGWEQCGDGLSCRPRESGTASILDALLLFFGHPAGSVVGLLEGKATLSYRIVHVPLPRCSHIEVDR